MSEMIIKFTPLVKIEALHKKMLFYGLQLEAPVAAAKPPKIFIITSKSVSLNFSFHLLYISFFINNLN